MDAIGGLGRVIQENQRIDTEFADHQVFEDEIRMFTDVGTAQEGEVIPVYLSQTTFDSIAEMFPYLTDRSRATGGGFVSKLDFRVFDKSSHAPDVNKINEEGFDVSGVWVVPLEGKSYDASRQLFSCKVNRLTRTTSYLYSPSRGLFGSLGKIQFSLHAQR